MEINANNKLPWLGFEPRLLPDSHSEELGFESQPWQFIICNKMIIQPLHTGQMGDFMTRQPGGLASTDNMVV